MFSLSSSQHPTLQTGRLRLHDVAKVRLLEVFPTRVAGVHTFWFAAPNCFDHDKVFAH